MAKLQGRGSAAEWMVVGVLVAVHCCSLLASSATFTVGGSQGWTIGPNYTTWAAGQTFGTGDVLFFPYAQGAHNVVEVDKAGYDACSASNAIATHTEGNTNVTLTSSGTHYFLCSFPSHCTAGMKLAVTVGSAGATPAPAPSSSVGSPPPTPISAPTPPISAPTPPTATPSSSTPSTAPVPSPVSAGTPTPTPTPASTPAPTPLSPSPASTPTPLSPSPASTATPGSTSSPPAPGVPSSPPSAAPSLPSAGSLVFAVLLCLSATILAL